MRRLILASVILSCSACATVDTLNVTAEKLTRIAIQQNEANRCSVHPKPCLSDDQFKAVATDLNKVSVAGREFTGLSIAGKASVKDASTFLATVATVTGDLGKTFTDGAIASVLSTLAQLQQKISDLLGKFPAAAPQQ